LAWGGYDYDNKTFVEVGKENLVRPGREIEIYDYNAGEYRVVKVKPVKPLRYNIRVEVTDTETGETRTFLMEGGKRRKKP
jgi:hypothetical protein